MLKLLFITGEEVGAWTQGNPPGYNESRVSISGPVDTGCKSA